MNSKQTAVDMPVKVLLGTKLGMIQLWDEVGHVVPITAVRVGANVVTQVRTPEADGYSTVRPAPGELKTKNVTKSPQGHFDKAGVAPRRKLVEVRTSDAVGYELGQEFTADLFEARQEVDIIGTSKDKGSTGVMRCHGFSGVSVSHGAHRNYRKSGLIGVCATPSRTFHSLRITNRMGKDRVTVLDLPVHVVDVEKGIILSADTVPGNEGGTVVVRTVMKGV